MRSYQKALISLFIFTASSLLFYCAHFKNAEYPLGKKSIITIDSLAAVSFEKTRAIIKYMTDEGFPETLPLTRGVSKIEVNTARDYVEIAFQDNHTITQYFPIKGGG
jgi:hypothetical protein